MTCKTFLLSELCARKEFVSVGLGAVVVVREGCYSVGVRFGNGVR